MKIKTKAVLYGVFAIIVVLIINALVLTLLNFPPMAMKVINQYWYLLILLIGGFGLQVGLFIYFHSLNAISCSTTVASGGISTISMILCCSHYLLNLLPFLGAIIGMSALTALADYTVYFLLFGILSNIIGISIMFYQAKKYKNKRSNLT